MAESDIPTRRRVRRSTRASRELAEARQRNAAQLAAQREQEQRVDAALDAFFGAGDQIAAAQDDCQRKIEPHERAITQLREQLDQTVAGALSVQAQAALTIHEADRTVEQVGELLRLGEKAARRLIAAGRDAAAAEAPADQRDDGTDDADRGSTSSADHVSEPEPPGAADRRPRDGAWSAGPAGGGDERSEDSGAAATATGGRVVASADTTGA
jgi:hypothetical protein